MTIAGMRSSGCGLLLRVLVFLVPFFVVLFGTRVPDLSIAAKASPRPRAVTESRAKPSPMLPQAPEMRACPVCLEMPDFAPWCRCLPCVGVSRGVEAVFPLLTNSRGPPVGDGTGFRQQTVMFTPSSITYLMARRAQSHGILWLS